MQLTYGTAGFRYPEQIILGIAYNIGQTCCVLSHQQQKPIGIMITASHNPYTDNGVKLMYYDGTMLSPEDEFFMLDSVQKKVTYKSLVRKSTVIIGMDTRKSSEEIKQLIIRGIRNVDQDPNIVDIGLVTTPELHHETFRYSNPGTLPYLNAYFSQISDLEYPHVVVDCANGVGSLRMRDIVDKHKLQNNIFLHHTDITQANLLNDKCGSDFVVSQGDSTFCMMDHVLHASLDGDADRIVCYYSENGHFRLLDGDYISALFAYYFYKRVNTLDLRVGVVHTAYANSRFLSFIHSLGFETRCTATGVKHLHRAAEDYDIGIYFESNGHGTVLLKHSYIDEDLSAFINPLIGDGVADVFAICYVLQELDISPKQWYGLFEKLPARTYKMVVKNKDIFKTNKDESRLITPTDLQPKLDEIMKSGCRVFIRPSGTEDIVRMHIEGTSMLDIEETKTLVRFSMSKYI